MIDIYQDHSEKKGVFQNLFWGSGSGYYAEPSKRFWEKPTKPFIILYQKMVQSRRVLGKTNKTIYNSVPKNGSV